MLVSNNVFKDRYVWDGSQTNFPISFPFLDNNHIQVWYAEPGKPDTDAVILGKENYTITGAGNPAGGVLTRTTAWAVGATIAIVRNVPITQLHQYTQYDNFPAESHEDALAKLTMIDQQQQELLDRSVKLPATDPRSPEEYAQDLLGARDEAKYWAEYAEKQAYHTVQVPSETMVLASDSVTPRTLADRFADVVNVKDFGAKGDGVADDTEAIQSALLLAVKGVFFPAGTYITTKTLVVRDNLSIYGDPGGYLYESRTNLLFKSTGEKAYSLPWCTSWFVANPDAGGSYLADSGTRGDTYKTLDLTSPFSAAIILGKGSGIYGLGIYPYFNGLEGYAGSDGTLSDEWDVGIWCRNADNWRMSDVTCAGHWRKAANLVTSSNIDDGKIPACEVGFAENCTFIGFRGVAIRSPDDTSETNYGLAGTTYLKCLVWSLRHQSGHLATSSALSTPFESPSGCLEVQGGTMRGIHFAFCTFIGRDDIAAIVPKCSELQFTRCYWESKELRVSGVWQDLIGSRFISSANTIVDFIGMTKYGIDFSPYYTRESSVNRYEESSGVCVTGGKVRDDEYMHPLLGTSITNRLLPGGVFRIYDSAFDNVMTVDEAGTLYLKNGNIYTPSNTFAIKRNRWADDEAYILRVYSTGNIEFEGGSFTVPGLLRSRFDNASSLGTSYYRWSEIFAGTGTINTSDERSKANVSNADEALMRAWGKVNFRVFQFKDAVEKKGSEARLHVGVIAQQVIEAFASEGLDATRYGLLCYDKWEDEYEDVEVEDEPPMLDADGNEVTPAKTHTEKRLVTAAGDRYGIRYSEALCLEVAYQRRRADRLEARTEILEKRVEELRALIAECSTTGYTVS